MSQKGTDYCVSAPVCCHAASNIEPTCSCCCIVMSVVGVHARAQLTFEVHAVTLLKDSVSYRCSGGVWCRIRPVNGARGWRDERDAGTRRCGEQRMIMACDVQFVVSIGVALAIGFHVFASSSCECFCLMMRVVCTGWRGSGVTSSKCSGGRWDKQVCKASSGETSTSCKHSFVAVVLVRVCSVITVNGSTRGRSGERGGIGDGTGCCCFSAKRFDNGD
jgi:hypothetical protein